MGKKDEKVVVRLDEVAEVFVGMATLRREGSDAKEVPVVQVGDIDERTGVVRPLSGLHLVALPDRTGLDKYRVLTGDVLVSCKGTLLKTGYIEESTKGALATSNVIVVRSKGKISPKTLFFILRSEGAKRILRGLQKVGSTIASLSYRDVQTLEFRLPSEEHQTLITNLLKAHREYLEATTKAMQTREELVNGMVEQALWGGTSEGGSR